MLVLGKKSWVEPLLFGVACILLLANCSSADQSSQEDLKSWSSNFFDLKDLLVEQTAVLPKLNPEVEKTVMYNGKAEQKILPNIDWKEELKILEAYNLTDMDRKGRIKEVITPYGEDMLFSYLPLDNETGIVRYEVIRDSVQRVRNIYIEYRDSTFAVTKQEIMELSFGLHDRQFPILKSYRFSKISNINKIGDENIEVSGVIKYGSNQNHISD